jgi:Cu/Zn superoxide dismutase
VIYNASVGDLFKLCVQHDGTGTIQVLANASGVPTFFQATWLGT